MDNEVLSCAEWLAEFFQADGRLQPRRVVKAEAVKAGYRMQVLKQARKQLGVRLIQNYKPSPNGDKMEDYWWV